MYHLFLLQHTNTEAIIFFFLALSIEKSRIEPHCTQNILMHHSIQSYVLPYSLSTNVEPASPQVLIDSITLFTECIHTSVHQWKPRHVHEHTTHPFPLSRTLSSFRPPLLRDGFTLGAYIENRGYSCLSVYTVSAEDVGRWKLNNILACYWVFCV